MYAPGLARGPCRPRQRKSDHADRFAVPRVAVPRRVGRCDWMERALAWTTFCTCRNVSEVTVDSGQLRAFAKGRYLQLDIAGDIEIDRNAQKPIEIPDSNENWPVAPVEYRCIAIDNIANAISMGAGTGRVGESPLLHLLSRQQDDFIAALPRGRTGPMRSAAAPLAFCYSHAGQAPEPQSAYAHSQTLPPRNRSAVPSGDRRVARPGASRVRYRLVRSLPGRSTCYVRGALATPPLASRQD